MASADLVGGASKAEALVAEAVFSGRPVGAHVEVVDTTPNRPVVRLDLLVGETGEMVFRGEELGFVRPQPEDEVGGGCLVVAEATWRRNQAFVRAVGAASSVVPRPCGLQLARCRRCSPRRPP